MLVKNRIDEVIKRENSFKIIKELLKNKNRGKLHDLTGLSGGFPVKDEDINLLENYICIDTDEVGIKFFIEIL